MPIILRTQCKGGGPSDILHPLIYLTHTGRVTTGWHFCLMTLLMMLGNHLTEQVERFAVTCDILMIDVYVGTEPNIIVCY